MNGATAGLRALGARARRFGGWPRVALALLPVAFACACALRDARIFAGLTIDDAYITFRYADNLARGLGPTFNAGEHVEGSSAFLFFLLLAPAIRVGIDPLVAARVASGAAFVALVAVAYATVYRIATRGRRLVAFGAAMIVAGSTPLAYYANPGLETDFYALLVALAFGGLVSGDRAVRAGFQPWACWAGLAAITRPEGAFLFAPLLALATARFALREASDKRARAVARYAGTSLMAFACVFLPVLVFRRAYYHAWLPNTVLAKSGAGSRFHGLSLADAVALACRGPGAAMVEEYAGHLGLGLALALAGLASARTRFAALAALSLLASCAALLVWSDGDWMGHERLLTPAIAPMAVAVALGASALFFGRGPSPALERTAWWSAAAASLALVTWGSFYERQYTVQFARVAGYMRWMGEMLGAHARDDDVLATDMAGRVPYFSRLRTIDTFGLCDRTIAEHGTPSGPMGKTDLAYVIRRRPTFYMFNAASGARDLYRDPAFAEQRGDYAVVQTAAYAASPRDGKILLVRRDRPDAGALAAAMGAELVDLDDSLRRSHLLDP